MANRLRYISLHPSEYLISYFCSNPWMKHSGTVYTTEHKGQSENSADKETI